MSGATGGVDGRWDCTIDTPMGTQAFTLEVRRDGDRFAGSVSGALGSKRIEDGRVSGDALDWQMSISKPIAMTLDCRADVTGDRIEGRVKAGFLGSYPLQGTRAA